MSIVDDLIENLVERNAAEVTGTFTIRLVDGGLNIKGHVMSVLRDQRKNKEVFKANAPVDATVRIGAISIPLPRVP